MFGVRVVFLPRWLKQINRRSIKKCHAIWHVVHRISSSHVVECNKWVVGCCIYWIWLVLEKGSVACQWPPQLVCTVLCERGRQGRGEKTCELTSSANVADTCNVSAALLKSRLTGQKKLAKATARRRRRHSFVLLAPHHCVHSVVGSDVLVRRSYSIVASSRKEQKSLARLYFYILLGNASSFSELNMLLQRIQSCGSHKLVCCVGLFNLWWVSAGSIWHSDIF